MVRSELVSQEKRAEMLAVYLLVIYLTRCALSDAVDCAMGSRSCESCHAAYPFCYWCEGQCRRYYGKSIAKIECAGEIIYESCNRENEKERLGKMLQLLESLKQTHSSKTSYENQLLGGESYQPFIKPTESAKKARLMRVLKLLKLLAVLEAKKKKNKVSSQKNGGIYNELEHEYLGKLPLENNKVTSETVVEPQHKKKHKSETDSDLDALLKMIDGKTTEAPKKLGEAMPTGTIKKKISKVTEPQPVFTTKQSIKTATKKSKLVVKTKSSNINISTKMTVSNSSLFTSKPTTVSRYCELFEKEEECNSDADCSWCNILGQCLGRTKEDFQYCTGSDKRSQNEDDQNDVCIIQKDCKSCTSQGKCFWCEKTKSCHTYPFFGFIPHNCPANMWYYKECDVQLAIFIILFPLLLILISMVIFYFCLRYCYYRKRTLKVQLFEKPELFEKRKGKKVYFVGGDEDDDESRTEQIRKKYNLPHEKEPLISP